jgi:hypothetical protein
MRRGAELFGSLSEKQKFKEISEILWPIGIFATRLYPKSSRVVGLLD